MEDPQRGKNAVSKRLAVIHIEQSRADARLENSFDRISLSAKQALKSELKPRPPRIADLQLSLNSLVIAAHNPSKLVKRYLIAGVLETSTLGSPTDLIKLHVVL